MSSPPASLQELLDLAMQRHRTTSMPALAAMARGRDYEINHTTLTRIRNGNYPSRPKRKTLEALAFLAGVPAETAREAVGLGTGRRPFAEYLPEDVDLLTERERDAILHMIRVLIENHKRAMADEEDAAPASPPMTQPSLETRLKLAQSIAQLGGILQAAQDPQFKTQIEASLSRAITQLPDYEAAQASIEEAIKAGEAALGGDGALIAEGEVDGAGVELDSQALLQEVLEAFDDPTFEKTIALRLKYGPPPTEQEMSELLDTALLKRQVHGR